MYDVIRGRFNPTPNKRDFCFVSIRFLDTDDNDDETSTKPNSEKQKKPLNHLFEFVHNASSPVHPHLLIVNVVIYLF